ncbi:hypothetical protein F5Y05DRAFT_181038 [Hypoxylon sp. FL0543]|nr:hypothetical protein F5Y05DRAFT_181038 [Hypoxylon sp. FL0543]
MRVFRCHWLMVPASFSLPSALFSDPTVRLFHEPTTYRDPDYTPQRDFPFGRIVGTPGFVDFTSFCSQNAGSFRRQGRKENRRARRNVLV